MSRLPDTVDKCGSCEQKAIVCGCLWPHVFQFLLLFFFFLLLGTSLPSGTRQQVLRHLFLPLCCVYILTCRTREPFLCISGRTVVPEMELLQCRARRRSSRLERSSSRLERWFCAHIFDIIAKCAFHFLIVGTFLLPQGVACISSCLSSCIMINGRNVNKVCVCLCVRCRLTPWLRQLTVCVFLVFPVNGPYGNSLTFFCLLLPRPPFPRIPPLVVCYLSCLCYLSRSICLH